jgi:biotin operon repressor
MIIDNYKLYYGRYVKNEWNLTPKEKALLDVLSDNDKHSNEELIEKCDFLSEASLRKYITMLRKKYIKIRNMYNTGYQMITEIRRNNEQ